MPNTSKNQIKQIVIKGSRSTKEGFNSTTKKEVNKTIYNNGIPGPGAYDLTFKDIIKMMDQKLAIRYQMSPFGSGKPRFEGHNNTIDVIQNSEAMPEIPENFVIRDKHAASDILNEHQKRKEKTRK